MNNESVSHEIVLQHLPLVKMVASRLFNRIPPSVDFEDLVGYGVVGLVEALKDFDPAKKVKFSTFAFYRVRGAMLDGLRALDTVSRSIRKKIKTIESAVDTLTSSLGRDPEENEVARAVNMPVEEIRTVLQEAQRREVVALEEELQYKGIPTAEAESNQSDQVEHKELIELMTEALKSLEEKERLVVTLYYYEGLTLKEIGEVIHVTESRVSQVLSKSASKLRKRLESIKIEVAPMIHME